MQSRLLILGWHNVEGSAAFPSPPGAGTHGLTQQLQMLAQLTHVVSLPEAIATLERGDKLPRRSVAITFDDGYRDNLDIAAPLLSRLGLPATFFLSPELLDGAHAWWETVGWAIDSTRRRDMEWGGRTLSLLADERASTMHQVTDDLKTFDEVDRRAAVQTLVADLAETDADPPDTPLMAWEEGRELVRMGFSVGSHSLRHVILANESPEAQEADLRQARDRLRENLGVDASVLAYPNGRRRDFNRDTVAAAKAASHSAAVTTVPGFNSPTTPLMELRRYVVHSASGRAGLADIAKHVLRRISSVRELFG